MLTVSRICVRLEQLILHQYQQLSIAESGIVNIKRGMTSNLTATEKRSVLIMRIVDYVKYHDCDDNAPTSSLSMTERISHRDRRREEIKYAYINCNFVLGYVADVKRIWPI